MQEVNADLTPLQRLQAELASGATEPVAVATAALARANSNAGKNVYVAMNEDWSLAEAASFSVRFPAGARPPLFGVPMAVKDCFDIAGFPTSCGSRFYAAHNGIAAKDSAVVARLRSMGAVITGKTHLHQLAYGITGENRDYGDCAQPRNADWLTGGSSSGSSAAVQEGSAIAAIGTDTGGSIRVPAALCGLVGYRSSWGVGSNAGADFWQGGGHLAPSFDTIGWLFRDLRDGPALAQALFGIETLSATAHSPANQSVQIGAVGTEFLTDCEPPVLDSFDATKQDLLQRGAEISLFATDFWTEAMEIFAGIQAHEAAALHRGHFEQFEPAIAERLAWGKSLNTQYVEGLRKRHDQFRTRMDELFHRFDFLIAPCAPMSVLQVGADHSETRKSILRYTCPISLAGMPVVTLPGPGGAGVQLIAARGQDARLLAYAAMLGTKNPLG